MGESAVWTQLMSQSVTKANRGDEEEEAQSGKCVTGQITMPKGETECEVQTLDWTFTIIQSICNVHHSACCHNVH